MSNEETKQVSPAEFVEIWQGCNSIDEVAKKTNRTYNSTRARGFKMMERGVPLKKFPKHTRSLDIEHLKKIAQESLSR